MIYRHSRRNQGAAQKEWRSFLGYLSTSLVLAWVGFVLYCWKLGLFNDSVSESSIGSSYGNAKIESLRSARNNVTTTITSVDVVQNYTVLANITSSQGTKWLNQSQNEFTKFNLSTLDLSAKPDSSKNKKSIRNTLHIVFSTDCSPYQEWQSFLLLYSASIVQQEGKITRIASGCNDEQQANIRTQYSQLYSTAYSVHFTPNYKLDKASYRLYPYYNKPRGLRHWLDNADPPIGENVVIAVLDPDMIFLRPLTLRVKGESNLISHRHIVEPAELIDLVVEGRPVAQLYGLSAPWTNDTAFKLNRTRICGVGSPCLQVEKKFALRHYSVGPPLLLHRNDADRITKTWVDFAPRVYEKFQDILAEMYAYSMAAAHENLPHITLEHYMVSSVNVWEEGWPWVDKIKHNCAPPGDDGIYFPSRPMPVLFHYCQGYRAGDFGFGKRQVPTGIFSCESGLLEEPPRDLDIIAPVVRKRKRYENDVLDMRRSAFSVCVLTRTLNAALMDFKQRMCDPSKQIVNYTKSIRLFVNRSTF